MERPPIASDQALAVLILRVLRQSHDSVCQFIKQHKGTVGKVERWFRDGLSYSEAVNFCDDQSIQRVVGREFVHYEEMDRETLLKAGQIKGADILRHYRSLAEWDGGLRGQLEEQREQLLESELNSSLTYPDSEEPGDPGTDEAMTSGEGEDLLTGSSSEVNGLGPGSNQGVSSKTSPGVQRDERADRLLGYRDALFQGPLPKPNEVIEIFLWLRWAGVEPLTKEHIGTAEERELFEKRVKSRGPYLVGCGVLMDKIETAVGEAVKSTELVLVDQVPLEPNKTPYFVEVWPSSGGQPQEYISIAIVAVVVRMIESRYDEASKERFATVSREWRREPERAVDRFLVYRPIFGCSKVRPPTMCRRNLVEGYIQLWWGELLIGTVKEVTWPIIEEVLKCKGEEQLATELWQEIAGEYERISHDRL